MFARKIRSEKGMATVEFSVLVSMALLMVFVIVDFGTLIQAQAVVTNITREGGSLASRDLKNGPVLLDLLADSSKPLDFKDNPQQYKIYLAKVDAGQSEASPDPVCTFQESGSLVGVNVLPPTASSTCDLPQNLYDLLKFDEVTQVSPISQFTVVKVYYIHKPMTPMEAIFKASGKSVMNFDYYDELGNVGDDDGINDTILISSKAVF